MSSNPNVADISVLEGLQAAANASMGNHPSTGEMAVFNVSGNVKGILSRLPKFKVHYDSIQDIQGDIQRWNEKRQKNPKLYDSFISKGKEQIQERILSYMPTEAKNIATLIDMEGKRLGFNYQPGATVVKEGVDPAVYQERKEFADAVNAFYSGTLPDGTKYTDYLR